MKGYHVVWEIEVDADSMREAAQKALEIQRDPESLAVVFMVTEHDKSTTETVDLLEEEEAS